MNADHRSAPRVRDNSIGIRSEWSEGSRTTAWDRLWHTILADLDLIPTTDIRESSKSEVGDA